MNILVADDERMVRLTLISMLHDLNLPLENIYEADNGENLLKDLKNFTPDIAFVDIKMPGLNGLEAIRSARELSPFTKWVILTAFPEFEYAKQAIELGVSKYLLKPISPQVLQETLSALMKSSSSNYYDLNKKFERDIIALYNKFNSANETLLENIITKSNFEAAVFYFDGNNQNDFAVKQRKSFFGELSLFIDGLLSNYIRIALFKMSDIQVATVCAYDSTKNSIGISTINSYFSKVSELAEKYSGNELNITILRNSSFTSYEMLNEIFTQIEHLDPLRVICGTGYDHSVKALTTFLNDNHTYLEFSQLILDLSGYYKEKKYLYFCNTIKQLEKMLSQSNFTIAETMQQNVSSFLSCVIGLHLRLEKDTRLWINALRKCGESLLEELDPDSTGYIDQVFDFVKENYMDDIGINTIADTLNITPNYLSALFHKKTNRKFIDYLTELRILKAKELLAKSRLSIEEISEMVGYHSPKHFSKLFLKYTKEYPSEYRKNLKG